MTLGDKIPSQLLREMRELARGSINDDALHQLWKVRLPAWIRPYLLVSPHINDLNGLADLADRLELSMGNSSVYAVHNREHSLSTGQSHLEKQIHPRKLGKRVPLSTVGAVGDSEYNLPPQELRLHLYDRNTHKKFLIDSGSIVSIIPVSHVNDKLNKHHIHLYSTQQTHPPSAPMGLKLFHWI
ncbi:GSCOCG00011979001-RA-CDS [Cotesia congregata]|nr:GSCOCG00011979001-RA-CDS [Cotesia congregata]